MAPGSGRSVSFFRSVLPALPDEPELGVDLLDPPRTPGETLVGLLGGSTGARRAGRRVAPR